MAALSDKSLKKREPLLLALRQRYLPSPPLLPAGVQRVAVPATRSKLRLSPRLPRREKQGTVTNVVAAPPLRSFASTRSRKHFQTPLSRSAQECLALIIGPTGVQEYPVLVH